MTTGEAKLNPYAPPAHASVAPPSRTLRPDERAYLSQLLACRNDIPSVGAAILSLLSRPAKATVATGVAACAISIPTGVLLELTPSQFLGAFFVLFLSIGGTIAYREIAAVRRSHALWEVASHVLDYSTVQKMLETDRLLPPTEGSTTMLRSDDGSIES